MAPTYPSIEEDALSAIIHTSALLLCAVMGLFCSATCPNQLVLQWNVGSDGILFPNIEVRNIPQWGITRPYRLTPSHFLLRGSLEVLCLKGIKYGSMGLSTSTALLSMPIIPQDFMLYFLRTLEVKCWQNSLFLQWR